MGQRENYQKQYQNGRSNLIFAIVMTVINIIVLVAGGDMMLLFSISFPYLLAVFGGVLGSDILMIGAVISLIGWLVIWILSKKKPVMMLVALILLILDTLALAGTYLLMEYASGIVDVLFHIWLLYYLWQAVSANKKLSALPEEPEIGENHLPVNSRPLRHTDEEEKCKVFLEETVGAYHICYRRVKQLNQLVVNGYIYDEIKLLVEPPHELKAIVDGHLIAVGTNDKNRAYICFDGEEKKSKIRWI